MPGAPVATAAWSSQRLVVMGKGGPRFFKLDINVDGQDLEQGFQATVDEFAKELALDFEQPIDWYALLDKPLVASGWLGNLVPAAEQREQLRGLYDANMNEKVDRTEFAAFLTRGLSRMSHVKFGSQRSTAPQLPSDSVWGPIDRDESGDLTIQELGLTTEAMLRYDFDGDDILTPAELRTASDAPQTASRRPILMDITPVQSWALDKANNMADGVIKHYSFSDTLPSDMLFYWLPGRLARFDSNKDSELNTEELATANDEDLDGTFQLRFGNHTQPSTEKPSVLFQSIDSSTLKRWSGHAEGGRLTLDGCIVTIVMKDEQSSSVHQGFKQQFAQIEKDPQLRAVAMQALELKAGALETLQEVADSAQLETADVAWRWMTRPRHWHLQATWSVSDSPWFELMDLNGDQRLVVGELDQFAVQAKSWDRNNDGLISEEEMPISVLLEVKRPEARGLRSRLGGTAIEKRGANESTAPTWFTGMDYNSDGELSRSEFLGDQIDFEKLDLDRDGIIEAREVSTPQ